MEGKCVFKREIAMRYFTRKLYKKTSTWEKVMGDRVLVYYQTLRLYHVEIPVQHNLSWWLCLSTSSALVGSCRKTLDKQSLSRPLESRQSPPPLLLLIAERDCCFRVSSWQSAPHLPIRDPATCLYICVCACVYIHIYGTRGHPCMLRVVTPSRPWAPNGCLPMPWQKPTERSA